jgi:hypothetical protein
MATGYRAGVGYRATLNYRVGVVAQYFRPTSDSSTGAWVTAPLYDKIDEATASDGDSISSPSNPNSATCKIKLSNGADPLLSTGHTVRYYQKDASSGQAINLTVRLVQGTTVIAQATHTGISNGWVTSSFNLSSGEADSITNYNDLYLEFVATGS